jgi:hypothetical protein
MSRPTEPNPRLAPLATEEEARELLGGQAIGTLRVNTKRDWSRYRRVTPKAPPPPPVRLWTWRDTAKEYATVLLAVAAFLVAAWLLFQMNDTDPWPQPERSLEEHSLYESKFNDR